MTSTQNPFLTNPAIRALLSLPQLQEAVETAADEAVCDADGEVHQFYKWRPRPKLQYQQHAIQCECRTIALTLPNQTGKTMTGSRICVARMQGHEPLQPERKMKTPIKVWVLTKGPLMEGLFDEILDMVPPSALDTNSIKRSQGRFRFRTKNKSILEMRSFDQSVDAMKQAKCDLIWIDELPVNGQKHWIELHIRLLRRGGTMLLTGTPDKFGHAWLKRKLVKLGWGDERFLNAHKGDFAWFKADMRDNDTLDPVQIERTIREIGNDQEMFDIKVRGLWPDTEGSNVFPLWAVNDQRANVIAPSRWVGFDELGTIFDRNHGTGWAIYEEAIPGYGYSIGVDLSEGGERSDYTAVCVLKVINNQMVASWHGRIDPHIFAREVYSAGRYFNDAIITPDAKGRSGGAFLSVLKMLNYPRIFTRPAPAWRRDLMLKTLGWESDQQSKPRMVYETKNVLVNHKVFIPCARTLEQLNNYQELREIDPSNHGFGAVEGNDDCVEALGMAIQGTKQGQAMTKTTLEMAYQYKDPRVGLGVAMVRGHLAETKRPASGEGWY